MIDPKECDGCKNLSKDKKYCYMIMADLLLIRECTLKKDER